MVVILILFLKFLQFSFNVLRSVEKYVNDFRFMRGELNTRNDVGNLGRVGLPKGGDMTPGTPCIGMLSRQPPSYQRMHSNDSGSGKGSDKDVNGNSGLLRD